MMKSLGYYYSKFFKKIVRGKSILDSLVDHTAVVNSGTSMVDATMAAYSYCGYDCEIYHADIGRYCSIANDVIIGGDQHPMGWLSTSPVFQDVVHSGPTRRFHRHSLPLAKRTVIGNDVWIGNRGIVMQGVTIGHGAVIGAGAVVTKDVPPYAVVAGVPAKVIKYRFDGATIAALLKSEWWNMPDKELEKYADKATNVREFIELVNNKAVKWR